MLAWNGCRGINSVGKVRKRVGEYQIKRTRGGSFKEGMINSGKSGKDVWKSKN